MCLIKFDWHFSFAMNAKKQWFLEIVPLTREHQSSIRLHISYSNLDLMVDQFPYQHEFRHLAAANCTTPPENRNQTWQSCYGQTDNALCRPLSPATSRSSEEHHRKLLKMLLHDEDAEKSRRNVEHCLIMCHIFPWSDSFAENFQPLHTVRMIRCACRLLTKFSVFVPSHINYSCEHFIFIHYTCCAAGYSYDDYRCSS